jgi:hypothetical protein
VSSAILKERRPAHPIFLRNSAKSIGLCMSFVRIGKLTWFEFPLPYRSKFCMGEGSETGLTKSQKILLVTNPSLLLIASSYYYKLGASSLPSRWHHFIITSKGSIMPSLATSYYYKLGASVPSRGDHLASSYYYKLIASVPSLPTSYYYMLRASVTTH